MNKFVFGYGSLVSPSKLAKFLHRNKPLVENEDYFCLELKGYKRLWNIVRDNSGQMGYKQYVLPDGSLPAESILLINISPYKNSVVNGVAFKVSQQELNTLDNRERNYVRVDVSKSLSKKIGQCYAFLGKKEAVDRYMKADKHNFVINKDYYSMIENGFKEISADFYKNYKKTTIQPDAKLIKLVFNPRKNT